MSKYNIGDKVLYIEQGNEVKYGVISSLHLRKLDPSYIVEEGSSYRYSVNERHDYVIKECSIIMTVGKNE